MRTYALVLFVMVSVSTAAAAEEQNPEKKDESVPAAGNLDLDLDLDLPPAPTSVDPDLDLDLDIDAQAKPAAPTPVPLKPPEPVVVEEPLPPPPMPEPPPLPVVTVKRVSLPPADPMPTPTPRWAFSFGVVSSVGGMSAATPRGLSVSDGGSFLVGGVFAAELSHWEARFSIQRFFQNRWLAANIRSDGGVEGSLHLGSWLGSPVTHLLVGVLGGGSYRSHDAPVGAWWKDRGPTPTEWRLEVMPSVAWHVVERVTLVVSLPLGYGFGSVDEREWRDFSGPFAALELTLRFPLL